nr:PREDICTED: tubulin-folding cofactor B [Bemisia tabaci]
MEKLGLGGSDLIHVHISVAGSNSACPLEKSFSTNLLVGELKRKLEPLTGANAATMKVKVFDSRNAFKFDLTPDDKPLSEFSFEKGTLLLVEDLHMLTCQELEAELKKIEKFELTEEEYASKPYTVQSFLKANKLGKYNPEEIQRTNEEMKQFEKEEKERMEQMKIGMRCMVKAPGKAKRKGTIKFIGTLASKSGNWIGVQYDEPLGLNDGTCGGVRYFECPPKYGGFVKPIFIEVGDFPPDGEEELFDDEL